MECDGEDNSEVVKISNENNAVSSVNATILNYYKKFGRKRDLEQYFSLSTAQSDVRDPSSSFWRSMKAQSDSDSGEKRSESSTEICRISIKCSVPETEPPSSQDDNAKSQSNSGSPPIIIEDVPAENSRHTDDESLKSDDNHSQKSIDATLDTSLNKAHSPSSSITSQRKLEWDSLADVGYANETDRKTSGSSLSTLERLALKQQYSNNDTKNDSILGLPTAHSTPQDENDAKTKGKKGLPKNTKFQSREVDFVEVNVPHTSGMNPSQAINVNLTKHISFNVERDGGVTFENVQKDITVKPEKISVGTAVTPQVKIDKEIQTSLTKYKDKSSSSMNLPKTVQTFGQTVPVLINLNTLKKRNRKKKLRSVKKRLRTKVKVDAHKENLPVPEKSGEQVSEAESFEYMPGHIYNQSQMKNNESKSNDAVGNKSSLESSGVLTTDSSKGSKHSFTKDLEKSIDLLKVALKKRYHDSNIKQTLIKEIVQRLLKSSYRGDETTTDFLSGLSFSSKKLGLSESNHTTTSTSDANNSRDKPKLLRPKKSILRVDKFNPNTVASTSQSAPNLPSVFNSEKPVSSSLRKPLISSNTDSDVSSREKTSSDTAFARTSSEELYQKYVEALRREELYKKHLKDKEMFLKQKLVCSEPVLKLPSRIDVKSQNRLKDLMRDLTRNNYDDGSGDASKLEGGSNSNIGLGNYNIIRRHENHSIFTLSTGTSDCQNKKVNAGKNEMKQSPRAGHSKAGDYCSCAHRSNHSKMKVTDSSVQVNLRQRGERGSPVPELQRNQRTSNQTSSNLSRVVADNTTGELKYVCLCEEQPEDLRDVGPNVLIYKCSRLNNQGMQSQEIPKKTVSANYPSYSKYTDTDFFLPSTSKEPTGNSNWKKSVFACAPELRSKSSQTSLALQLCPKYRETAPSSGNKKLEVLHDGGCRPKQNDNFVHEAIRCIQTEISIDPKISDPSLSDINIINDADCVKLIGQHYRETSKSTVRCETNQQEFVELYAGSEFSGDTMSNNMGAKMGIGKGSQSDIDHTKPVSEGIQDNFTIPIEDTNMTLMVSLGSKKTKAPIKKCTNEQAVTTDNIDTMETAIETDVVDTIDTATSLREECSKGVQSQNTNIFNQIYSQTTAIEQEKVKTMHNFPVKQKGCIVSTIFTREGFFNTNPGNTQINEHRPLAYPNTSDYRNYCPVQTDEDGTVRSQVSRETITDKYEIRPEGDFYQTDNDNIRDVQYFLNKPKCMYCESLNIHDKESATMIENVPDQKLQMKPKCKCSELSRCAGICGEDAKCMRQKPMGYLCKDKGNQESPIAMLSMPKQKLMKISTDDNGDCVIEKPINILNNDNKESPRTKLFMPYPNLVKKSKCQCPVSSKCGGNCADDAPCISEKRISDLNKDKGNQESVITMLSMPKQKSVQTTTDDNGDCDIEKSMNILDSNNKEYARSKLFMPNPNLVKKSKCQCPISSTCGGNCADDAPCLRQKPISDLYKDKDNQESVITMLCMPNESDKTSTEDIGDCVIEKPINILDSDNKESPRAKLFMPNPNLVKKSKCQCPVSSKCGGNCADDAHCIKEKDMETQKNLPKTVKYNTHPKTASIKKPFLRSNTDTGDLDNNPIERQISRETTGTTMSEAETQSKSKSSDDHSTSKDAVLEMIQDITKRYSKKDIAKNQRKKCFKEVMTILNYLLDTEDGTDSNQIKALLSSTTQNTDTECSTSKESGGNASSNCQVHSMTNAESSTSRGMECPDDTKKVCACKSQCKESGCVYQKKNLVDKAVQLSSKKSKSTKLYRTESSDIPISTDAPCTSSDSATCKVLNKIRRECEKYHQKRCSSHHNRGKKCEASSSTSAVNCDQCKRVHHCACSGHKCRCHKPKSTMEKIKKKCIAYNLIIQTSESMISEETTYDKKCRPLQNIIVKVPPKHKCVNVPFKELSGKIEGRCSPRCKTRCQRSRSLPNESGLSSTDDSGRRTQVYTVREYLETNRPDFVEQCSNRQNCLKMINETRASERAAKRELLSMQLQMDQSPTLISLSEADLRHFARDIGADFKRKKDAPKFISEREMKKHSKQIFKLLPEVVQKKEEARKEKIKKTNLLMANIFKKNLQKQTLRGAVNLSNYNTVVKI